MNQVVWMVWGDPHSTGNMPNLWETKLEAEKYAREMFPNEHPDIRYGRIFYKEILNWSEGATK